MEPEPGVPMIFEDLYEDENLPVPDAAIEKWLAGGRAKLVLLEDMKGQSVLNDIESFAYDPNDLTLIIHDSGVMRYLYLLVGEMTTAKGVRDAGTVLTALQKRYYGRSRAGQPKNIAKLAERIEKVTAKDGKSQKQKAAELEPSALSRAEEVALSKTKNTIKTRKTR
jgi:hypothetical protein